jgi:CheY-like chemotaxis protein
MASVLLVDDEQEIARVLLALLKLTGHQGHYAASAREGLQFLTEQSPSLVLLDIMMPEMDGIEMLSKIRHDPKLAAIPVIMYTGADDPALRVAAEKLGISAYLIKGRLDFAELRVLIERHGGPVQ